MLCGPVSRPGCLWRKGEDGTNPNRLPNFCFAPMLFRERDLTVIWWNHGARGLGLGLPCPAAGPPHGAGEWPAPVA